MKTETKDHAGHSNLLTLTKLEKLKNKGFRYVMVKGFTSDKRLDYVDPRYIVLVPMKDLPGEQGEKEIYEPIDSKLLRDWANEPDQGVEVLIASAS
jgi:hypothetical protein